MASNPRATATGRSEQVCLPPSHPSPPPRLPLPALIPVLVLSSHVATDPLPPVPECPVGASRRHAGLYTLSVWTTLTGLAEPKYWWDSFLNSIFSTTRPITIFSCTAPSLKPDFGKDATYKHVDASPRHDPLLDRGADTP